MVRHKRNPRNKNRTWDSPTHVWVLSTRLAALVMLIVFGVILQAVLTHHCKALNREIAKLESGQRKLVEDLSRERVRWNQLKTPRNLDIALSRHGIAMTHPSPLQVVHMTPSALLPGPARGGSERTVYASR